MAGRDISCSKMGLASARIIGTCALGGKSVGTAAALCRKYGCMPRDLMPHIKELQQTLLKQDVFLPGFRNEDDKDLARCAKFTASSHTEDGVPENVINGISRSFEGKFNGWRSNGISPEGEVLQMQFDGTRMLSEVRLTFDCGFRYPVRITMAPKRQTQQRPGAPSELVKDYDVVLKKSGNVVKCIPIRENIQRHNVVNFDRTECDSVEFLFRATHGARNVTVFEVRAYEVAENG